MTGEGPHGPRPLTAQTLDGLGAIPPLLCHP